MCIVRTTSSIAGQRLGRLVHDEVGALGHDLELVVGDDRGDLDDDVAGRVEPGHLEIHPDEHGRRVLHVVVATRARRARAPRRPGRAPRPRPRPARLRQAGRRRPRPRRPRGRRASRRAAAEPWSPPASRSRSPRATPGSCSPAAGWPCATASPASTRRASSTRLPRRAQGAAGEPRPHRGLRGRTAATASPSSWCRPWPRVAWAAGGGAAGLRAGRRRVRPHRQVARAGRVPIRSCPTRRSGTVGSRRRLGGRRAALGEGVGGAVVGLVRPPPPPRRHHERPRRGTGPDLRRAPALRRPGARRARPPRAAADAAPLRRRAGRRPRCHLGLRRAAAAGPSPGPVRPLRRAPARPW